MDRLLSSHDLTDKSVLLRLDLDVPLKDGILGDLSRLKAALPTLRYCLAHAKRTMLIGHLGRPEGRDDKYSLLPVKGELERILEQTISFVPSLDGAGEWRNGTTPLGLLENLRFYSGEDKNDPQFAYSLSQFADLFIQDAFAASHRPSASGIGVPKLLPSLLGFQFQAELRALDPIIKDPKHPIIAVIGGAKADKIEIVDNLLTQVDQVLVGGTLATLIKPNPKIVPATLTPDGLDIDSRSVELFSSFVASASTLIWNGPMGKYEDSHSFHGTYQIAEAIANTKAYKVAGGGDTLAVVHKLKLEDRFDHLSTAGGAMFYYLTHHTLPALEAVNKSPLP